MGDTFASDCWAKDIFESKVVFCTGGSGDICSAQIKALVALGANACIVGRDLPKAQQAAQKIVAERSGSKVLVYKADVRDLDALDAAAAYCARELGGIDFVIAGAAGNFLAPFLQLSAGGFRSVVEIDLIGSFHTAKATTPYLLESSRKRQGGGRIVFISSTTQYTGSQLATHGAAAKAAIDSLSAQLAIELGPRGVTSNVIAPGAIAGTEGFDRLISPDDERQIPLGRFGNLTDMGNAVVFLFSDAGSYVNGVILVVDGGAWRVGAAQVGGRFAYPDVILTDEAFPEILRRAIKSNKL